MDELNVWHYATMNNLIFRIERPLSVSENQRIVNVLNIIGFNY